MSSSAPPQPQTHYLLLALAFLGFISLGLPDAVIGVAWPGIRETFELQQSSLGIVLAASSSGYFLSSFFSGRLIHLVGIGALLAASSVFVATSAAGYAWSPLWLMVVGAAVLHGLGSGAIDAGLNNYAASHFTARHMNWLHACYCLGAMLGPLLMTAVVTHGHSWRIGYAMVGTAMLVLSCLFAVTLRQWGGPVSQIQGSERQGMGVGRTLANPVVWLQIVVFFVYTGLEVTVGQWSYTLLTESRGVAPSTAGVWVGMYWGSIGVGRVLLGFVVEAIGIDRLLRVSTLCAIAGAVMYAVNVEAWLSLAGLLLIGLALAPVFPCLMTRTPQRLSRELAHHAIGFQVSAAMIGAAALPGLTGTLAQSYGLPMVAIAAAAMAIALWLLHEALLLVTK